MQKKKLPRDPNSRAAAIVAMTAGMDAPNDINAMTGAQTGNPPILPTYADAAKLLSDPEMRKQIMREMGSRGGKKGGKARAEALSPKKRKEIGKKAADTRWKSKRIAEKTKNKRK